MKCRRVRVFLSFSEAYHNYRRDRVGRCPLSSSVVRVSSVCNKGTNISDTHLPA
jgi:hypothetical protein